MRALRVLNDWRGRPKVLLHARHTCGCARQMGKSSAPHTRVRRTFPAVCDANGRTPLCFKSLRTLTPHVFITPNACATHGHSARGTHAKMRPTRNCTLVWPSRWLGAAEGPHRVVRPAAEQTWGWQLGCPCHTEKAKYLTGSLASHCVGEWDSLQWTTLKRHSSVERPIR